MKKRYDFIVLVAMCLAAIFVFSNFYVPSDEDYSYTIGSNDIIYSINADNASCSVAGVRNINVTSVYIPANHNGYPVTKIEAYAFSGCSGLIDVTIERGFLTTIGEYAFENCSQLVNITLNNGVTLIENYAFSGCANLAEIKIPRSVTKIGEGAFSSCTSLEMLTLPYDIRIIEEGLFYNSGLTEISLPGGIIEIQKDAFRYCDELASIKIPRTVSFIAEGAFNGCKDLSLITFDGTMDEWMRLSGNNITDVQVEYLVQCSDGVISKAGVLKFR